MLFENSMRMRGREQAMVGAIVVLTAALCGCSGGQESKASEEQVPKRNPIATESVAPQTPIVQSN